MIIDDLEITFFIIINMIDMIDDNSFKRVRDLIMQIILYDLFDCCILSFHNK